MKLVNLFESNNLCLMVDDHGAEDPVEEFYIIADLPANISYDELGNLLKLSFENVIFRRDFFKINSVVITKNTPRNWQFAKTVSWIEFTNHIDSLINQDGDFAK